MAIEITSDSLIPIDTNFRLKAGPGAGKTHWLINHIKNVIANSTHLQALGRIACLTYSNIGVDTIVSRLGHSNNIEIVTLHSFLYSNIVRPYLYLICEREGFNLKQFTGIIDDFVMDDYHTCELISKESKQQIQFSQWSKYLKNLRWRIRDNKIECTSTKPIIIGRTSKAGVKYKDIYASPSIARIYKKLAWAKGILNYDDVNYFAVKLLLKHNWIGKLLAISYPYIFVDEFQDTNPLQAAILQEIGKYPNSHIGIIGDTAQSIYKFQGATPQIFNGFKVPKLIDYEIKNNRRSLKPIVDFLNKLRDDLPQVAIREENGEPVRFLIGTKNQAFTYLIDKEFDFLTLSHANVDTNALRYQFYENRGVVKSEGLDKIDDSNHERKNVITCLIKSIENARNGRFKFAFSQLERSNITSEQSVIILKAFLSMHNLDSMSLFDIASKLITFGITITPITKGKCLEYYSHHKYGEFAQEVSIEDNDTEQRTIHKAKGGEATNVLLTTNERFTPNILFDFDLMHEEYHRVHYVAMSRARDRLYIHFHNISPKDEEYFIEKWGVEIIHL